MQDKPNKQDIPYWGGDGNFGPADLKHANCLPALLAGYKQLGSGRLNKEEWLAKYHPEGKWYWPDDAGIEDGFAFYESGKPIQTEVEVGPGLNNTSSPPFELPHPKLPEKRRKNRQRTKAGGFVTPKRSRASGLWNISSHSNTSTANQSLKLEQQSLSPPNTTQGQYYTAAWGSPYDIASSPRASQLVRNRRKSDTALDESPSVARRQRIANLPQPKSAGLPQQNHLNDSPLTGEEVNPSNKAAYDLTGNWIREYHRVRTERKTWLSDGSENSDDSISVSEDLESWPAFHLPTPEFKARNQSSPSTTPTAPGRDRRLNHRPSDATVTQEDFDVGTEPHSQRQSKAAKMLSALMSGGIPRRERNSDSISEKVIPEQPPSGTVSGLPTDIGPSPIPPRLHKQRPSTVGSNSFQRPKKKVVWKGKTCTIALPLEDVKDSVGNPKIPLKPEDVAETLRQWELTGISIRGFDLSETSASNAPLGQSRDIYPDPKDAQNSIQRKDFPVRIPNKQWWDEYVKELQEAKLRALGVTVSGEEISVRSPSLTSPLSRQASSHSSYPYHGPGIPLSGAIRAGTERVLSPPASAPGSQFPFPQNMVSPSISSVMPYSAAYQAANQPDGFTRDRVFSPFSLTADSSSANGGTQYLGSMPNSRGVSPLISDRRHSIRSLNSPVSPLPEMQNIYMQGNPNHPLFSRPRGQPSPLVSQDHNTLLQQEVSKNLSEQTPTQFLSQPDIASPLPQGRAHRHNVSESLQKEIDEAEYHLEESIARQMDDPDNTSNLKTLSEGNLSSSDGMTNQGRPQEKSTKSVSIVSDIETNPSQGNSPVISTIQAIPNKKSGNKASISKLNVNAQEFVFNPAKAAFAPMFTFGEKPAAALPPTTATSTGDTYQKRPSMAPTSHSTLNVDAPAFVPGKPFEPSPRRVFSFASTITDPKPEIPAFTPGVVFGEIPGGLMDKRPAGSRIFSYNGTIQLPKKTKAVPIVQPETEEDTLEDEEGRPMQAEGRQKRARRSGGSGDEAPVFAAVPDELIQPKPSGNAQKTAKDIEAEPTLDTNAGISKDAQSESEKAELEPRQTIELEKIVSMDDVEHCASPDDSRLTAETTEQQLEDQMAIGTKILYPAKDTYRNEIPKPIDEKDFNEPIVESETENSEINVQDQTQENLASVFEELGKEEEQKATDNITAYNKPSSLVVASPPPHIPSSPGNPPDTALNTADFLKTPANVISPIDNKLAEGQVLSITTNRVPPPSVPTTASQPVNLVEDPFTIGDHDEGNVTDKSIREEQTAFPDLIPSDETLKAEKSVKVSASNDDLEQKTPPVAATRKSTLSATAKPFVFNPFVSEFKPESVKQMPVQPVAISKQDDGASNLPSPAPVVSKSRLDGAASEHGESKLVSNDVAIPAPEPLPKKLPFVGGLGASRYAPEPTVPPPRQLSPSPMASTASPQITQAVTKQEESPLGQERPSTPEIRSVPVEQPRQRVSSPELSPLVKEMYQLPTENHINPLGPVRPPSMDERIANGVKYVEPSFNEIDDVMRQLNGDDSDIGIERDPEQVWRSPKAVNRKDIESPERIATPESERLSVRPSRIPTASPNHLDRPFQYLPKQDYGSSNTEDSKIRDAEAELVARNARFSPSFKGHHHVKLEISPVHKLKRRNSGSISNWDDVVSSGEESDFHRRVGFFDNRVGRVIANAMDGRLQPIEATLTGLTAALSKIGEQSRSGRPRRGRSVESDADDEDDDTGVVRAVSPFMKDRRFEKLRSILLDAAVQHNAPNTESSKILESIADLKTELSKRQDPPVSDRKEDDHAVQKLSESLEEIKTVLSSQQLSHESKENTRAVPSEQILSLEKTVNELQASFAEQQETNAATIKSIIESTIGSHMRGQSATIKSSQESATVEKLQLQLSGLESLLKNAEERAAEEYKIRRGVEDRLAETERELRSAVAETTHQRDAAEETERGLQSIVNDHRRHKEHTVMLEEVRTELEMNNSDLQAKNAALEDTIAEYRISHDQWRKDIDAANADKEELVYSIRGLRKELEEGIASRHALKNKFERIENEMLAARHNIARDQAMWRHKDEEHKAKYEASRTRLEAEARTRERLELEIDRLEKQEQEALKARTLVENIQSQNKNLAAMVEDLRFKEHSSQEQSMSLSRELHDVKERSQLDTQRLISINQSNIETSSQQMQVLRTDLESVIHHLEDQLLHSQTDAKSTKERYQALLEEASISKDTALREAAEAREAALQEHYRFHERTMHEAQLSHERALNELKADHVRAAANAHEDRERAISNLIEDHNRAITTVKQEKTINDQDLNGQLTLSNDKVSHLQDKIQHLEDKLTIATSAAQAAAEAARTARNNVSSSPATNITAPSLRGFDPQALRQTVETLQDQLGERERQIENLEQRLENVDMDAPAKVKERDAEITWLRELLGVRMDDMQDIIVQLSTPHFDRAAVRDAVIRLRTSLQMEQQERERQLDGVKFPSFSDIKASPKSLPLAAAAAWGSWRKGQTSLSSLAEMAVPSSLSSANQTPSKSSPQSYLSGLLTPPSTNVRQATPRGSGSLSQSTRAANRPLAAYSTPKRQISAGYDAQQDDTQQDIPETPALLTKGSYDADAPEGPHHYSLDQYVQEQIDVPSEDNSQQGDGDSSSLVPGQGDKDAAPKTFEPSIELAG